MKLSKLLKGFLIFLGGLAIGWLIFHSSGEKSQKNDIKISEAKSEIWTCSMHPQIRMSEQGKCPICGMDLIPLAQESSQEFSGAIHLSEEAIQLANVRTDRVTRNNPVKEIRLYGKVQADERLLQSQVVHTQGRIEKLLVNFEGEKVSAGQTLALIYSPSLVTAQQEFLEAKGTKQSHPEIYEASKEKLRQLKLTEEQISEIETSDKIQTSIGITSNTDGVVSDIKVRKGDYLTSGTVLFEVTDLSKLWIMFEAYEGDIEYINKGDKMSFSFEALPGMNFSGNISFVDPVVDPVTRVSKVRVEIGNETGRLKPEMFATGIIHANLTAYKNPVSIPRSAVLWTGKRSIVYIKDEKSKEPVFRLREIELGPLAGENYIVTEGLKEGEEIVTSGAFSIDASSQLEGKPSMMNLPAENNIPSGEQKNVINKSISLNETFEVSGNCELCKDRIEAAAKSVKGVTSAVWDMTSKKIRLAYDGDATSLETVQKAIAAAGHDNGKFRAPDDVYKKLPECCLYRK